MLNQATNLGIKPSFFPAPAAVRQETGALEREFRRFYIDQMLPVVRAGLSVGLFLAAAVCILDLFLMPQAFSDSAIPLRLFTMLIPMSAVLGATFLARFRTLLPYAVASSMLLAGAGTLLVGAIAAHTGAPVVAWGTIFVTFNVYLVMGLTLRQSVAVGWPIFIVYVAMGLYFGASTQKLAYGVLFLGFSNFIGTYVSFLLERDARQIFTKERELVRLSRTDGLTGLFNRRAFDEHLKKIWKQARRDDKRIAVVVADIDHFKLYNDCYGHQDGDVSIKAVADALAESIHRPLDLVARYGGEEFICVLYDPTVSFLETYTQSVCQKVIDLDIEHKASEVAPIVSLSIGAAIVEANGHITVDQLIRQADDALYEAKNQGRNQAIVYRPEWGQQTTAHLAAVLV